VSIYYPNWSTFTVSIQRWVFVALVLFLLLYLFFDFYKAVPIRVNFKLIKELGKLLGNILKLKARDCEKIRKKF
jgi:hypothetical protein